MEDTLVNLSTAKLAKEKGFDEITDYIYSQNYITEKLIENINGLKHSDGNNPFISAPTQSLLQKWLREVHNIHIRPRTLKHSNGYVYVYTVDCFDIDFYISSMEFTTYESALEQALKDALQEIKK
jgi:hypothetical protein